MEFTLGILSIVFISALVVDWLLTDKDLITQLAINGQQNNKSNELQFESIALSTSKLFCRIFDSVYGNRTWSWKRFYRSAILSCLFVLFSVVIVGIEETFIGIYVLGNKVNFTDAIFLCTLLLSFNTIIDFVSLQETRLVLGWVNSSKDGKLNHVAVLIVVDLVLTSFIFIFLMVIFLIILYVVMGQPSRIDATIKIVLDNLFLKSEFLPFFISTFGTSIVWFAFVVFTFLAKILSNNPLFAQILKAISETTSPARVVAVIFTIPLVSIFLLFQLIGKAL